MEGAGCKVLNLKQSSGEWLAVRLKHFTASDAAAAVGENPYKTREQLIGEKLGIYQEPPAPKWKLDRMALGHEAEKLARPKAEDYIGDFLYPFVLVRQVEGLPLLASFDGLTLDFKTGWEHKLLSRSLERHLELEGGIPKYHIWQMEHQALVAGCERIVYFASDGNGKLWKAEFVPDQKRREKLIEGWLEVLKVLEEFGWLTGS